MLSQLPRRPSARVLLFALAAALAAPTPAAFAAPSAETIAQLKQLPASNPYRAALLRLVNIPEADRVALQAWADYYPDPDEPAPAPVLTADQRTLAAEFRDTLIASSSAPALDADAWPLIPNPKDPDNPAAVTIDGVAYLRQLARISLKSADSLPADEAVATYAAVAQLGRQQRAGLTLIEQLTGVAIEGVAFSNAARRLDEFSPDGLRRLSAAWTSLHPLPTNAEAFAGERDAFFLPMIERIIAPGLHALLADPDAGKKSGDDGDPASDSNPFRDLRLSGLVRLGPGEEQISLENSRTRETIVLRNGRPADGLELVSIDFENHRALIRRGEHEAFVNLRTKDVVALDRAARQLREMFDAMKLMSGGDDADTIFSKLLPLVHAHPEGVDGYARDLLAQYQSAIDRQVALAESAKFPAPDAAPANAAGGFADPLVATITPVFGRLGRTLNNAATYPAMFQAAIQHRLAALDPSASEPALADPWSEDGASFAYEPAPDGGFLLRSRYEVAPDAPLTYKFAAPDAGYIRPKN